MFISQAFAQTAEIASEAGMTPQGGAMDMIIQFALIIFIIYFLLIRPQQKRIKKHEMELKAIIKGTKIVVAGIVGTVVDIKDDDTLSVEVANNVQITVMRPYVSQVIFDTPTKTKKKK